MTNFNFFSWNRFFQLDDAVKSDRKMFSAIYISISSKHQEGAQKERLSEQKVQVAFSHDSVCLYMLSSFLVYIIHASYLLMVYYILFCSIMQILIWVK